MLVQAKKQGLNDLQDEQTRLKAEYDRMEVTSAPSRSDLWTPHFYFSYMKADYVHLVVLLDATAVGRIFKAKIIIPLLLSQTLRAFCRRG